MKNQFPKIKSRRIIPVAFFCFVLLTSCAESKSASLKKEFGKSYEYFLALQALEKNDEKTAARLLKKSRSSPNKKISRLAAEQLIQLGNVTEKFKNAKFLLKEYKDAQAALTASRVFFEYQEYSPVISASDGFKIEEIPDELAFYRLCSLSRKNDRRFESELFDWWMKKPVSEFHRKFFYSETEQAYGGKTVFPEDENDFADVPEEIQLMAFRLLVFQKNYRTAFKNSERIFKIFENKPPYYMLVSDLGKAALYGTDDFALSARRFELLAEKISGEEAYCAHFYAARLYDSAGREQEKAVKNYEAALKITDDKEHFKSALWYLLNIKLRISTQEVISTLEKYASRLEESSYFDDFFENLSVLLLSRGQWQNFYRIWKIIDGNASSDISCKYAYISARLIEEGLVAGDDSVPSKEIFAAWMSVLNRECDVYYKVLAVERLNISEKSYLNEIFTSGDKTRIQEGDKDAELVLAGYAAFGFPQKIYPYWLSERGNISLEASVKAAAFLSECGKFNGVYSVESLRLASRAKNGSEEKIPYELLRLLYPRYYEDFVNSACEEFDIPPEILYALIRSESFFDAKAGSFAGAQGLTQLMPATAEDVARRLKMPRDFDIFDPETNIRLGSYYYSHLVQRTEGKSFLLGMLAYNAGLTNVRRWKKQADMPFDLYLETLPFAETREYGRKLTGAAAIYGFLYYDILPGDTVRKIMR